MKWTDPAPSPEEMLEQMQKFAKEHPRLHDWVDPGEKVPGLCPPGKHLVCRVCGVPMSRTPGVVNAPCEGSSLSVLRLGRGR